MVHTLRPLAVIAFESRIYYIPYESRPVFGLVVTISIKPVVLFGGTEYPTGPIGPPRLYALSPSMEATVVFFTQKETSDHHRDARTLF